MSERYYVVIRRTKFPRTALKLTHSLCRAGIEHIVLGDGRVAVRGSEIQKVKLGIYGLQVIDEDGKIPPDCCCYRQEHEIIVFRAGNGGIIEVPKTGKPQFLTIGGGPKNLVPDHEGLLRVAVKLGFIKKDVLYRMSSRSI